MSLSAEESALVERFARPCSKGRPEKYMAMITVAEANAAATLIKRLSAVPSDARLRLYFPIIMPLNADGHGPASEESGEIRKITWEVWDQYCDTFGRFDCLADAIMEAERLNRQHYAELSAGGQP